jgi:hypothetical protein
LILGLILELFLGLLSLPDSDGQETEKL